MSHHQCYLPNGDGTAIGFFSLHSDRVLNNVANVVANAVVASSAVSGMEWKQLPTVAFPSVNAPMCGTAGCITSVGAVLHHAAAVKSYERMLQR